MIGRDIVVSEQRLTRKGRDIDLSVLKDSVKRKHTLNLFNTISLMFCLWTPPFPFVIGFTKCGLLQGILLFIGTGIIVYVSSQLFLYTWVFGGAFTYEDIWEIIFPRVRHLPAALTVISYLSMCVNLTLVIPRMAAALLEEGVESLPAWLTNRWLLGYIYIALVVIAVSLLRAKRLSSMYPVALLSNIVWLMSVIAYLVAFGERLDTSKPVVLFVANYKESFIYIGSMVYVLFLTPLLSGIGTNVDRPSVKRINIAFGTTFAVRLAVMLLTGTCGYFVDDMNRILFSGGEWRMSVVVLKVCVLLSSLLSNWLLMLWLAHQLCRFTLPGHEESTLGIVSSVLVIGTLTMIVTLSGDPLLASHIIVSFGAVSACIVTLICGPLTFVSVFGLSEKKLSILAVVMMIIGVLLTVCLVWSAIRVGWQPQTRLFVRGQDSV